MSVVIETTLGDLTVDLFTNERPIACLNFLKLCQLKYYNFNLFHTVQQGFIAQTGDPTGAGDGGSSVWGVVEGLQKRFFEAEYLPRIHHSSAGMLSLVSAGKNLVGSQFFFTLGDSLTSLDGTHCVIGEVVEGHDVLRKLNDAIVDDGFRPYQDIRITHTVVLEDPFPNPRGLQAPSRSPSPSAERLKNGRIAADEDIDDTDGKTMEEMQEMLADREAKARATILEIVGDLPDADMAPPENVLFVCKLNPVTTDDDLEIIFSRFGVVKGCEVIRDRKTGDSLQYAFVEFEDQKSCEAAYFKMDNVLIDDRRIHVDFSQSVSKVTWRGKGRGVVGEDGRLDFDNLRDNKDHRKPTQGRGRADNHRYGKRSEDPRSRMNSAERRTAREQRHNEQKERDDRRNVRRRSGSREQKERRRSTSRNRSDRPGRNYNDQKRFNERDQRDQRRSASRSRNDRRRSRSRDMEQRRRSRSRDMPQRKGSRSRDQAQRRPSRTRDQTQSRRSRDRTERRRSLSRDRNDRMRDRSPQDRRRNENGSERSKEPVRNRDRSAERRPLANRKASRDRQELKNSSRKQSPERKRKLSASTEKKTKKQTKKKSKRAASSSSESSESSSESESEEDSSSSDSSSSSSSSSSSDVRSKRKKSKKTKQKAASSKSSHKSKKKHHRN